jgi:hypothetical protein
VDPVATVRFEANDAWVLWCVLRQGCDLEDLIRAYTFVSRTAVPPFDELAGCLSRAVRAGLMPVPENGRYRLAADWYDRLHRLDEAYGAAEVGLTEFEEQFLAQDWPAVGGIDFVLPAAEYQQAADRVRQYHARLFGR